MGFKKSVYNYNYFIKDRVVLTYRKLNYDLGIDVLCSQ